MGLASSYHFHLGLQFIGMGRGLYLLNRFSLQMLLEAYLSSNLRLCSFLCVQVCNVRKCALCRPHIPKCRPLRMTKGLSYT